jgi:hypothetical protein
MEAQGDLVPPDVRGVMFGLLHRHADQSTATPRSDDGLKGCRSEVPTCPLLAL